jgi:hypothetical protein
MMAEGNNGGCEIASIRRTLRGQRPPPAGKLHAREPGGPTNTRHEVVSGPVASLPQHLGRKRFLIVDLLPSAT